MISIIRTAKEVDFCCNGLRYRVRSNNAYQSNGSIAELVINVNSNVVSGNVFTLSFGDKNIRFTVAVATDDSGTVILAGSTVVEICDSLKKNYLLQKYYTISYIANRIFLRAKKSGSFYSLSFWSNNGNISFYANTPGTDKTLRSGYKTLVEIYLEKDRLTNNFELVATSLHNVDANGVCDIYSGKLLAKYFSDIDLPDYNQSVIKKVSKTIKRYYLKLAEMYEGSVKMVISSNTLYAADGAIVNDLYNDSFNYLNYANTNKSYLLHPDITKFECWSSSQHFLYFLNYLSIANISQKVKIYYTDGTNTTVTKSIVSAVKNECFIIPCGFDQLSLSAVIPSKEAYKYEVYLENNGVLIGKSIVFYLVPKPLFGREFWFKNSMGAMEAVLFEKQTHKLDIKRSELLSDNNYKTDIDEIYSSYECLTGNKTMQEIEHLAEFVSSKKVYLLQKGDMYEVAIEQGNYTLADEHEDLYSYKFKYRVMNKSINQSNMQIIITSGGSAIGFYTYNKKVVLGFSTSKI